MVETVFETYSLANDGADEAGSHHCSHLPRLQFAQDEIL